MSSTTTSTDATPKTDTRILAVVIILSIIGFLLIAGVVFFTYRRTRKHRRAGSISAGPYHGMVVDKDHPAALVTPFGAPGSEGPKFLHTPGADMRIAIRRPDGAWHFNSPRSPFTPTGISEPSPLPSPVVSSMYLPAPSVYSVKSAKELEVEAQRRKQKDKEEYGYGGYDIDVEGCPNPPPPAYGYEPDEDPFGVRR